MKEKCVIHVSSISNFLWFYSHKYLWQDHKSACIWETGPVIKKAKSSRWHQRQKQETTVEKVTHEGEKELTLPSRIIAGPKKRNRTSSLPWKGSVGQLRNIPEDARLPGCKCAVVAIEDSRPTSRDRGEGIALQNVLAPKGGRPSARSSDSWIR